MTYEVDSFDDGTDVLVLPENGVYCVVGEKFDIRTSLPPVGERLRVRTKSGRCLSTIFESDLIRLHVLCKWKIIKWKHD